MRRLARFLRKDEGAVTVDWVVLTALGIALLALVIEGMTTGTTGLSDATKDHMASKF
jgi:hypothetical protein